MILADTSIWIDHLRSGSAEMQQRLSNGQIAMHPFIVAEIALGSMRDRRNRLSQMDALYQVPIAQMSEVRRMIESRQLYSKGLGLVDVHLLLSCLLTPGLQLWTRDNRMEGAAMTIGVGVYRPATP
ncbi:MAG TPA: type II toxin-antitoxin system VapC family toxin [Terracidiphilus sp.]|nr:type II toxin-antitoxin system VapC family toxin [Terracidiphilus sp.]